MIKWSIQQEGIAIVNIYAPNIEASKYIKQILTNIKGESDSNTLDTQWSKIYGMQQKQF